MLEKLQIIKGIHPGLFLEWELKKRNIRKGNFALSLMEYPQTLVSITKGKRRMNTALALKIEQKLELEEGFLMFLQVFYDINKEKQKLKKGIKPNLSKIRPIIFWDTTFDKIDWEKQKNTVIIRVFERGNEIEKNEIIRFYGKELVNRVLNNG